MTNINNKITLLCIPKMETYIQTDFIRKTIENKNIGNITRIIELPHKNNPNFKRVIIHVYLDENSQNSKIILDRFSIKKDVKIIYNFPRYWKIVEASNHPQK